MTIKLSLYRARFGRFLSVTLYLSLSIYLNFFLAQFLLHLCSLFAFLSALFYTLLSYFGTIFPALYLFVRGRVLAGICLVAGKPGEPGVQGRPGPTGEGGEEGWPGAKVSPLLRHQSLM